MLFYMGISFFQIPVDKIINITHKLNLLPKIKRVNCKTTTSTMSARLRSASSTVYDLASASRDRIAATVAHGANALAVPNARDRRHSSNSVEKRSRKVEVKNKSIRFPSSGASVDPTAIFRDITRGTSFEHDEAMQGHLKVFTGKNCIVLSCNVFFTRLIFFGKCLQILFFSFMQMPS